MGDRKCEICLQEDKRDIDLHEKGTPALWPTKWEYTWAHAECAETLGLQLHTTS